MSVAINRVTLAGHLARDPELKQLSGGRVVARFAIAINRHWRDAEGQRKEDVTFVDCDAWGRTAELTGQYLSKGQACLIEGHLQMNQWEDADGKKHSRLKVVADSVQFLSSRNDGRQQNGDNKESGGASTQGKRATAQSNSRGNSDHNADYPADNSSTRGGRRVYEGPSLDESAMDADAPLTASR